MANALILAFGGVHMDPTPDPVADVGTQIQGGLSDLLGGFTTYIVPGIIVIAIALLCCTADNWF